MTQHQVTTEEKEQTNRSPMCSLVLTRLKEEAITPRPRWQCLLSEYGRWFLWALTVVLAALVFSVALEVMMSAPYALYEATHSNFLTFFMDIMPLLWLTLLVALVALALYELRQTKRGYRYSLLLVIGSSFGLSLFGAVIFHVVHTGFWLDQSLGRQMPYYMSLEKQESKMWHNPAAGRFVGVSVIPTDSLPPLLPSASVAFKDVDGVTWTIITDNLTPKEEELLHTAMPVRIIATSTSPLVLHLCAVLPWLFDHYMPKEERLSHKTAYRERIEAYERDAAVSMKAAASLRLDASEGSVVLDTPCATVSFKEMRQPVSTQ